MLRVGIQVIKWWPFVNMLKYKGFMDKLVRECCRKFTLFETISYQWSEIIPILDYWHHHCYKGHLNLDLISFFPAWIRSIYYAVKSIFKWLWEDQYLKELMMTICQKCEQFKMQVKEWSHIYGVMDPLPYMNDMVEQHGDFDFEEFKQDGTGCSLTSYQCSCCHQWWEISAWEAIGTLEIWPQFHHLNN